MTVASTSMLTGSRLQFPLDIDVFAFYQIPNDQARSVLRSSVLT